MTIHRFFFILFFLFSCTQTTFDPITIALSQAPASLDPRYATDAIGMRIGNLIFQSLVRIDKNLKVQPSLAHRWKQTKNTYTFYVQKGKKFSNGRLLKKEDIEFSFQQYQSPKTPFHSAFKVIQNVQIKETPHEFQIILKLKKNSAVFLPNDLPLLRILPKKEILSNENQFQKNPIGTGPFSLVKRDDNHIHLQSRTKNQDIVFKVIRDELTRYQKILRNEIDIIQNELSYLKIDQLSKKQIPYQFFKKEGFSVNYLLFNMKDPLFKNKQARKALALGLNTKNMIQMKFKNYVVPANSLLHPGHSFFNQNLAPLSHQPQKAQSILKKNNWTHQKIILTTSNNREVVSYARLLASQIRKIGFQVELKSYEWGTFYGDLKRGNFQTALLRWVGAFDPDIYRIAFHSSEIPPKGRNRGSYINKKLDALLDQGRTEQNTEKRKKIYQQVQQIIHQDLPIIPLWHNSQLSMVKNEIKGYFLPANGSYDYLTSITKAKIKNHE